MHKESAKKFLKRTQPDAWEGAYKSAVRIAREMGPLSWEQRAALFNGLLGILAEQTTGSPQHLIDGNISACEGDQARQFVASASAVLGGLLLELCDSGEDLIAAAASLHCALFLASCPIDGLADAGLAAFKKPGGAAKLDTLLDQFPNFRALAVADVFNRTGKIIGRGPKLH